MINLSPTFTPLTTRCPECKDAFPPINSRVYTVGEERSRDEAGRITGIAYSFACDAGHEYDVRADEMDGSTWLNE